MYYPSVSTPYFPVHKWTYVIVSIRNNSLVDLYINGKLIQSNNYNGNTSKDKLIRPTSNDNIRFGNKLDAYLTNMYINSTPIDTNTAWKKYLKGNSKGIIDISVDLTQNNVVSNRMKLI
jgi:hypothetical protein